MRRFIGSRIPTVVLAILLVTTTAVFGQAPAGAKSSSPSGQTVAGRVLDPSQSVIIGATVTLRSLAEDRTRDTQTDARGVYRFDQVAPGSYLLIAFRDGFTAITEELEVTPGVAANVDLTLHVAGFKEEVTVAFTALESRSALKMDTPLRDVPLTVNSYTGSFMKTIESTNVGDLYSYTTGVTRSGNTGLDFVIRGVRASHTGNIQYNGLPGLAARVGSPSTVNVERLEVLKGPSSVLYGQAQPGGLINIITKKPQAERQALLDIRSGGTFGGGMNGRGKHHVSTDLTGPIDSGRKFLYRFIASYDDENSFRDNVTNKDLYLVPSLSWMGWAGAVLNIEAEYRRTNTSLDSGLVAPFNDIKLVAPANVRYQEPSDYIEETGKTITTSLKKSWANGVTWTANWRSVWHEDLQVGFENAGTSGTQTVTRRDRRQRNLREYHYVDTTIGRSVKTGSVNHKLLFGSTVGYEMTDYDRQQFATGAALNIDLYRPVFGAANLPLKPNTWRHSTAWTGAGYLNDQIELSAMWKVLLGLRFEARRADEEELRVNPKTREKNSQAFLPLAGLVFQPIDSLSLYGSYSTSFTPPPPGAIDKNGENPFKPESARQFEWGAKLQVWNGGELSVSWFDITKNDVLITLVAQAVNDQIGQERSKGLETTFNARLLNNWQVIVGYAYTDSEVSKDSDPAKVGSRIPNSPRHGANFWTRYDVAKGALSGLGAGLGVVFTGERAGTISASSSTLPVLLLPGYTRLDLGVYYVKKRYELTLRVVNLTDKKYYESNLGTTTTSLNIRPGAPRSGSMSLRVRF